MAIPAHIVFVGAATVDLVFAVEQFPQVPGKVLPHDFKQVAHGMATSAATAAARLGGRATLIARIGADAMGERFISEIEAEGVDCTHVRRFAGVATPVSAVIVDRDGERLVVPYYDKGLGEDADWIAPELIGSADAVLVDVRWPKGARRALELARAAGKIAVLDGDVGPREALADLAALASHSVFSAPAALALTGAGNCRDAVEQLAERFAGVMAVTDGADGCYWLEGGVVRHASPPKVVAVDTLAAGDVFHGAFTLALAEGQALEEAVSFANVAAAMKCTVFGGRLGAPRRDAVEARLLALSRGEEIS